MPQPGEDRPDDDFVDSDCDGIDGNAANAVFVSPSGSDSDSGTREAPYETLTKAIEVAQSTGKDVYVCNAIYAENVLVLNEKVALFGGYDCNANWARTKERAHVQPASGVPLTIRGADGTSIDRFELDAPDAVEPGESSIAVVIDDSSDVKLNRVGANAGDGAEGTSFPTPAATTAPAKAGLDGAAVSKPKCAGWDKTGECGAMAPGGYDSQLTFCPGGSTLGYRGGKGGAGGNANLGLTGQPGGAGYLAGGMGGKLGFAGSPGKPGVAGSAGAPGGSFGSLAADKYVASNYGGDGTSGAPGQAGGGGSGGPSSCPSPCADFYLGSGGGQGGYPGCGGAGGKGGGGGGASIAVLIIQSQVELTWCSVRTGVGGAGGAPSAGSVGQPGGPAGKGGGGTLYAGQPGGDGGNGGKGGPGGPGGGGPSIGILVQGPKPTTHAVTFDIGSGGQGAPGIGGPDGADGTSADVLVVDEQSDAGAGDAGQD